MGSEAAMSTADCERLRPYLLDMVVGELDPSEHQRVELEEHLAGCPACRAAVEELRGTGRALEAVRVFDSQLNEQVRQDISRQAHLEAEKLREARERGRAKAALGRPVPVAAWVLLVLGALVALAAAWAWPHLGLPGLKTPGARVLGASGIELGPELAHGELVSLPEGALLHMELAGGSRLALRGPAEARLAGAQTPLEIRRGSAWLAAVKPVQVQVSPLRSLMLAADSQAAIEVRPADDEAVLVAVLGGSCSYAAAGGEAGGKVTQGETLAVQVKSGAATKRASKELETAPWRKNLPNK